MTDGEDILMIPKYIHYCWFGSAEKSETFRKCIRSWESLYPDYEIMEWNETNSDFRNSAYAMEAYACRKFAFVADYVRLKVLAEYGGIYLDTDVEMLKRDRSLEDMDFAAGFEADNRVGTAVIFAQKKEPLIVEWLQSYENRHFQQKNGKMDLTPNVRELTELLKGKGWQIDGREQRKNRRILLPRETFYPYSIGDRNVSLKNSLAVHWCEGSWVSGKLRFKHGLIRLVKRFLGKTRYERLRKLLIR